MPPATRGDSRVTSREFVAHLPDLIDAAEYANHPDGGLMRLRISVTEHGVEVLGDAFRPQRLDRLLDNLGGGPVQQMLCG